MDIHRENLPWLRQWERNQAAHVADGKSICSSPHSSGECVLWPHEELWWEHVIRIIVAAECSTKIWKNESLIWLFLWFGVRGLKKKIVYPIIKRNGVSLQWNCKLTAFCSHPSTPSLSSLVLSLDGSLTAVHSQGWIFVSPEQTTRPSSWVSPRYYWLSSTREESWL